SYRKLTTVKGTVTSWIDRTAPGGGRFTYAVSAVKNGKTGKKKTVAKILETRPSQPKLTGLTYANNALRLTWKKAANATGYLVYRKASGGRFVQVTKTPLDASILSYTDYNVQKSKTYSYTVQAVAAGVRSTYSKTGLTRTCSEYRSIENTASSYSIEADVKLTGTGSGYHAKLVACTPTSAVSFGIQFDEFGIPPYTNETTFIVENVISNNPGDQKYFRTGYSARNKTFHLMLTIRKNGLCEFYVDGVRVGKTTNKKLANQEDIALRIEGSARLNGDSVNAKFSNIRIKKDGKYDAGRIWNTHPFITNKGLKADTSRFDTARAITISGKIKGLTKDQDWDSAYGDVSSIIQFW
ncbi:MAG: fibronectin type III domain-containing protein, partial [Blautia sp.]|nr:fibronectin type III domain-containing protein [Blautia sp.]